MPGPVEQQTRLARLSTSAKMFLILTLALLPLGVIASLSSLETARANRASRALAAHLLAGDSADRLNLLIERAAAALRGASAGGARACRSAAEAIGADGVRVAAVDRDGALICGYRDDAPPLVPPSPDTPVVRLDPATGTVRVIVEIPDGAAAAATLPATMLAQAIHPNALDGSYDLVLSDAAGAQIRVATMRTVAIGRDIVSALPAADSQIRLTMTVEAAPLSANEVLLMLLPLLMWVAAAAIGWLIVDRLILRPLGEMQVAIDRWRGRGGRLAMPRFTTPAREIRVLGEALAGAVDTIEHHEADLEEGLARQTRLTREVHHRVKNNLQVVASLLNIHARGASAPDAIAAYGAIQRRVDALALVHRSHYAELEVNHGLALKPLIGELASALRASAPAGVQGLRIMLDVPQVNATQDVAVSVAFLVTELVEQAMLRLPRSVVSIALALPDAGDRATLTIASPALARDAAPVDDAFERCERVVTGLARQLRTSLDRDDERGAFVLNIPVLPIAAPAEDEAARIEK